MSLKPFSILIIFCLFFAAGMVCLAEELKPMYGPTIPDGTPPDHPAIGQLYNISVVSFEQEDLWEKRPEVVDSLLRELERVKQLDKADKIRWQQGQTKNRLIRESE